MNRNAAIGRLTNTPIKAYLSRGYFAPSEIKNKLKQIDKIQIDNSADFKETSEMIKSLKEDIAALRYQYGEINKNIHSFTTDVRLIQVLELRYLEGLSINQIANEMGYCGDHILRLHKKALEALEKYLDENGIKYK